MATITLAKFITNSLGRFRDYDKKYGYQCVDLIRYYLVEVLGIGGYSLSGVNYAKDLYNNFKPNSHWQRIKNTPTFVPQAGDIVIWDYYPFVTGWAGHVGIFVEGDVNRFISFDQNYPTKSPCSLVKHSYRGVLGVLRYIK